MSEIFHEMKSSDPQYVNTASRTLSIDIINNDDADVKLWMINPTTNMYAYDVKFIPFFVQEGKSVSYGIRLDTIPLAKVEIKTSKTMDNALNILDPPDVAISPTNIIFNNSNWNLTQRIEIKCNSDDVDHNMQTFRILHNIFTDDSVLLEKTNSVTWF